MKKITSLIIAAMLLLGMTSCSDKGDNIAETTVADTSAAVSDTVKDTAEDTDAVTETETSTETAAVSAVTEESTTVTDEPAESLGVSTYTETFVNGECSVTLVYPRYGDSEHELFDISMRNYVMQKYNQSGMMPEDNAVYEITACSIKYESEYFVSAVMEVHIINVTAARDSMFAYTVNADPRNGRIYLSEELIGELDSVKSAFAEGKFEQSLGVDGLMDEVTPDYITQSWRQDYGVFPDMYFTEDTFGVVAELPHVLGGYAGFEIPYAEASDMINNAAKGLAGLIVTTD